jgi:hypothetical protein
VKIDRDGRFLFAADDGVRAVESGEILYEG